MRCSLLNDLFVFGKFIILVQYLCLVHRNATPNNIRLCARGTINRACNSINLFCIFFIFSAMLPQLSVPWDARSTQPHHPLPLIKTRPAQQCCSDGAVSQDTITRHAATIVATSSVVLKCEDKAFVCKEVTQNRVIRKLQSECNCSKLE